MLGSSMLVYVVWSSSSFATAAEEQNLFLLAPARPTYPLQDNCPRMRSQQTGDLAAGILSKTSYLEEYRKYGCTGAQPPPLTSIDHSLEAGVQPRQRLFDGVTKATFAY
jgi:hypothetical protein